MTETLQDLEIACQDCGETFVFTAAEAEFYKKRALSAPPKRCKPCRDARSGRGAQEPVRYATGDPNEYRSPMQCAEIAPSYARAPWGNGNVRETPSASRGGYRDGAQQEYRSPAFGGSAPQPMNRERRAGPPGPRPGPRPRTTYTAICAQCGATAHVPFAPSRGRQVFCKGCFDEKRGIVSEPSADPER
jgi:CxxC-x17-CxxC domain-containing protein